MDSVQAWRQKRAEGERVTLPSGNVATLRRVHLLDLVKRGRVPDTLSGLVTELVEQKARKVSLDDLGKYVEVIDLVCCEAFVDPPVAREPSDEALGVDEVDVLDRLEVFRWCNEAARRLRPFRDEPPGAVAAAQPGA